MMRIKTKQEIHVVLVSFLLLLRYIKVFLHLIL